MRTTAITWSLPLAAATDNEHASVTTMAVLTSYKMEVSIARPGTMITYSSGSAVGRAMVTQPNPADKTGIESRLASWPLR